MSSLLHEQLNIFSRTQFTKGLHRDCQLAQTGPGSWNNPTRQQWHVGPTQTLSSNPNPGSHAVRSECPLLCSALLSQFLPPVQSASSSIHIFTHTLKDAKQSTFTYRIISCCSARQERGKQCREKGKPCDPNTSKCLTLLFIIFPSSYTESKWKRRLLQRWNQKKTNRAMFISLSYH